MKTIIRTFISATVLASAAQASSQCLESISPSDVLKTLVRLDRSYGDVHSTIQCASATLPAERIICANETLQAMELLDTKAYAYAFENATQSAASHENILDGAWVEYVRNQCTTAECLCAAFKAHTADSLGGTSPYHK